MAQRGGEEEAGRDVERCAVAARQVEYTAFFLGVWKEKRKAMNTNFFNESLILYVLYSEGHLYNGVSVERNRMLSEKPRTCGKSMFQSCRTGYGRP